MKKLIIILLMLFFFENSFSQQTVKKAYSKDYYTQRSKNQNTTGWILLVGGTAMVVGGAIGLNENFLVWGGSDAQDDRALMYGSILIGGIVSDLVSIPFFISAGHNRRKAANFNLSSELIFLPQQHIGGQASVPSISLKIKF